MSNHSEPRDLKSDGIHYKNKYKFMILKITIMVLIKEAFVGSHVNTKSTLQYPFGFCLDVSFLVIIYSSNWHLLFVLSLVMTASVV